MYVWYKTLRLRGKTSLHPLQIENVLYQVFIRRIIYTRIEICVTMFIYHSLSEDAK